VKIKANRELHNMISDQDFGHDCPKLAGNQTQFRVDSLLPGRRGGSGARGPCHHGTRRRCRGKWLAARLVAIVLAIRVVPAVTDGGAAAETDVPPGQARETADRSQMQQWLNSLVAMKLSAIRVILRVKKEANFGGGVSISIRLDGRNL
jgi:hypothetical protein